LLSDSLSLSLKLIENFQVDQILKLKNLKPITMKLICVIATSILLSKGNASPLNWGVYTKQNNQLDYYENELPGLKTGDYVDDYDTYLNADNYDSFQGLDYNSLQGNADLIDAGSEMLGMSG